MFRFTTAALCLMASTACAEPHKKVIDDLASAMIGDTTPGLAVAVLKQGKVWHMAGYGLADVEEETPVTTDTIFDLASVSKQMTAMAAKMQTTDSLYTIDTPVADFLPAFAKIKSDRPIQVVDLLYHMSGLADYLNEMEGYFPDTPNADVVKWLAKQPLDAEPGTEFSYSNSGYIALGSLVAAADGADSLAQVLQTRIWEPLGMTDTALVTPVDPDRRVTGYAGDNGEFNESSDDTVVEGDGNVLTTIADMAKYETALAKFTLLDEASVVDLFLPGRLDDGEYVTDPDDGEGYGWGWFLTLNDDGDEVAEHSGAWAGTSTLYHRNLTTGVTVILLANGEDADLYDLAAEMAAAAK